jgi:3-hydroxyacyl-[acyl-carrier-protein] dehydratase
MKTTQSHTETIRLLPLHATHLTLMYPSRYKYGMEYQIKPFLPHRKPFLFVDNIIFADDKTIIAEHAWTRDEYFFEGHFPGFPVVPGVILIEAMAQAGGAGLRITHEFAPESFFVLASVDKVKFRRQIYPETTTRMEIINLRVSTKMFMQAGKVFDGKELACEARWMCVMRNS